MSHKGRQWPQVARKWLDVESAVSQFAPRTIEFEILADIGTGYGLHNGELTLDFEDPVSLMLGWSGWDIHEPPIPTFYFYQYFLVGTPRNWFELDIIPNSSYPVSYSGWHYTDPFATAAWPFQDLRAVDAVYGIGAMGGPLPAFTGQAKLWR
jgi:hypothetical protein